MKSLLHFIPALLVPIMMSACSVGPGRCIGEGNTSDTVQTTVLINLDSTGVAIEGYDPVAYFTESKAVKGLSGIRSTHAGATYHFATAEHRQLFESDPDRFIPQFGGYCAYAASINTISPVDPEYWEIVEGRLLLQHNQKAWDLWHKDAKVNLVKADRNWPGIVERNGSPQRALLNVDAQGLALEGYDPTSYFLDGKPRKGDSRLSRRFQGATYYFVDSDHKNAFEREPAKYVPRFGGFCGYAASINKVSPVDPRIWQLVDDRLVLQHTPRAFELFNQDVAGNYAKADRNWPALSNARCH